MNECLALGLGFCHLDSFSGSNTVFFWPASSFLSLVILSPLLLCVSLLNELVICIGNRMDGGE